MKTYSGKINDSRKEGLSDYSVVINTLLKKWEVNSESELAFIVKISGVDTLLRYKLLDSLSIGFKILNSPEIEPETIFLKMIKRYGISYRKGILIWIKVKIPLNQEEYRELELYSKKYFNDFFIV